MNDYVFRVLWPVHPPLMTDDVYTKTADSIVNTSVCSFYGTGNNIGIMTETRGDNGHFNKHFKLGLNDDSFQVKIVLVYFYKLMLVLGSSYGFLVLSFITVPSRRPL